MWTIATVAFSLPGVGWVPFAPDHVVYKQSPAMTEEACHVAAWDTMMDEMRKKGVLFQFNVECVEST